MSPWTEAIISQWQEWRNADQQDKAVISRSDVITLLVEIERLQTEVWHLKAENGALRKVVAQSGRKYETDEKTLRAQLGEPPW